MTGYLDTQVTFRMLVLAIAGYNKCSFMKEKIKIRVESSR